MRHGKDWVIALTELGYKVWPRKTNSKGCEGVKTVFPQVETTQQVLLG